MTSTLGTYSFLPWLRQGLANRITPATRPTRRARDVSRSTCS